MFVCFHRSALLWEAGGGPGEKEEVGGLGPSKEEEKRKKERQKKKEGLKPESAPFPSLSFPLPGINHRRQTERMQLLGKSAN